MPNDPWRTPTRLGGKPHCGHKTPRTASTYARTYARTHASTRAHRAASLRALGFTTLSRVAPSPQARSVSWRERLGAVVLPPKLPPVLPAPGAEAPPPEEASAAKSMSRVAACGALWLGMRCCACQVTLPCVRALGASSPEDPCEAGEPAHESQKHGWERE